jgi:hypothetical protein
VVRAFEQAESSVSSAPRIAVDRDKSGITEQLDDDIARLLADEAFTDADFDGFGAFSAAALADEELGAAVHVRAGQLEDALVDLTKERLISAILLAAATFRSPLRRVVTAAREPCRVAGRADRSCDPLLVDDGRRAATMRL